MSRNNITNFGNTSLSSSSIVDILNFVKQQILVYLPLVFIIFGFIGFICNTFTFLQPILRFNTCCIYLLCASLVDITNLFINLLPNYTYSTTDDILILITTKQLCKWKLFGLVFLPQLSMKLLILSLIDRYACTCSLISSIRHIRRLEMVPWIIAITILISAVISFYSPFFYDVTNGFGCITTNPLANGVLYIVIHGVITPFVMLVFVLLTYRNVKRSRQRACTIEQINIDRSRNPFIRMILTQVLITSFLILQWIIYYVYHVITLYNNRNKEQRTSHYFILYISNNIYYLIHVKSFYLSTLTSRLFRETFVTALFRLIPFNQQRKTSTRSKHNFTNISSKIKSEDES